jgi:hypothetical protein
VKHKYMAKGVVLKALPSADSEFVHKLLLLVKIHRRSSGQGNCMYRMGFANE